LRESGWRHPARPALITMAVVGALALIAPHLYGNTSLLFTIMTFVVLAEGLNLMYGFTGYLPFGYVGFFGTGAYGTALLVLHTHLPVLLCVAGGGVASAVIALILGPLLRLSGRIFRSPTSRPRRSSISWCPTPTCPRSPGGLTG
jgi:amino acid/amide ABC transporter membrane protein 2, HAAT family (TC 3.A.1.4.-)